MAYRSPYGHTEGDARASAPRDVATSRGELRAAAQPSAEERPHAPAAGAAADEADEADEAEETMERRRSVGDAVGKARGQPSPPSASASPRHGVLSWLRRGSRRGGKKGSPGSASGPEDSARLPVVNEMPDDEPSFTTPSSHRASGAATEGGAEGASGGGEAEGAVVHQLQQEPASTQPVQRAAVVHQRSSVSRLQSMVRGKKPRNSLSPASSPAS